MAAHAGNRGPTRTRRAAVLVDDPILTSKITVPDIPAWAVQRPRITALIAEGARVLGNGELKIGAHGKPVLFLHPKDFCGTLVELEEA